MKALLDDSKSNFPSQSKKPGKKRILPTLGIGRGKNKEEKEIQPSFSIKVQNPKMLYAIPGTFISCYDSKENPIIKFPKHSILFKMDFRSSEVSQGVESR